MHKKALWILSMVVVALAPFIGFVAGQHTSIALEAPKFPTPYQVILLDSGQVFFGKLEGYGTRFPVLREVYYVKTMLNQQTHQQDNILLRRSQEIHAPDHMTLNGAHIVLVEPVSRDSKAAALIAELKHR